MRGILVAGVILMVAVSAVAELVGVPASEVTVSVESITVTSQPLVVYRPMTQDELAEQVRTGASVDARVGAMAGIQDQEEIFKLLFKPGLDTNVVVRVAAINRIAEVDIVRMMAAKCRIPEVREAANRRLEFLYAEESDRSMRTASSVVVAYARRLNESLRK